MGSPAPRWGAISGGDPPSQANTQIQTVSWLAGGQDASQLFDWDEIWQLQIDGTIAENIQNAIATWTKTTAQVPAGFKTKTGAAGTVMRPLTNPQYSLLSFGGCDGTIEGNATCAGGDAHTVVAGSDGNSWNIITQCPSARYGAVLAQNHNDMFSQQVFMLFGLSDPNQYDDTNLTTRGEIGVLHVDQGVWSRVLPSCDPGGAAGVPECPIPREGATVISSRTNLVSGALDASDIIVFGGRDKDGNYLNDVWLLRATNATIQTSNQTDWGTEYGDGVLQSGKFQNGRGVTVQVRGAICEALCSTECSMVQFLDQCTVKKNITTPTSSGSPNDPSNTSGGSSSSIFIASQYDTSVVHKALAGASVVALLPALVLFRASSPNALAHGPSTRPILLLTSGIVLVAAWLVGVVGFVISIVTLSFTPSTTTTTFTSRLLRIRKRADEVKGHFHTSHGISGLIIFTLLYFILPLCVAIVFAQEYHEEHDRRHSRVSNSSSADAEYKDDPNSRPARPRQSSSADKLFPQRRSIATTPDGSHPDAHDDPDGDPIGAGERVRLRQGRFAPSGLFKEKLWPNVWGRPLSQSGSQSNHNPRGVGLSPELKDDNASRHSFQNHSASPSTATAGLPANETGFVVLNRNKNALVQQAQHQPDGARGLAEDRENSAWLYLRRNLNYMGDVDYMISKLRGTAGSGAGAGVAVAAKSNARKVALRYPSLGVVVGRILAQVVILALVVFCGMSIALQGGDGLVGNILFALFVFWAVVCYAAMYWLAWNGRPRGSVLVVAISRLRGQQHDEVEEPTEMEEHGAFSDVASHQAASTLGGATYGSRAVYRRVHDSGSGAHVDDDDDDNHRLEEEIGRRDVCAPCFLLEIITDFLLLKTKLDRSQSSLYPNDHYLSLMQARHSSMNKLPRSLDFIVSGFLSSPLDLSCWSPNSPLWTQFSPSLVLRLLWTCVPNLCPLCRHFYQTHRRALYLAIQNSSQHSLLIPSQYASSALSRPYLIRRSVVVAFVFSTPLSLDLGTPSRISEPPLQRGRRTISRHLRPGCCFAVFRHTCIHSSHFPYYLTLSQAMDNLT